MANGKLPFSVGNTSSDGPFSIAMLACRRVVWRPTLVEAPSLNDSLRQDRCENPHERKGIDKDR